MESEERQQYEAFLAKLSPAQRRKRHQHILAFVKKQKQVARRARYVSTRFAPYLRIDVNQEWGHHLILLETLFEYPEEAWADPVAMREHRRNPVWRLARITIEMKLRPLKLSRALIRLLTDFAFPAAWDRLSEKMVERERKEQPQPNRETKQSNAQLRYLAAQEKLGQRSGNSELLRWVESQWPREVKAVWAGHCWYGRRLSPVPLSYLRQWTKRKKGRPQRLLVRSFRSASLKALTERNFTKSKASLIVDKIETMLGISKPLYVGRDLHLTPYRVDAILKSQ